MDQNLTYTYIGCNKYQFYGKFFVIILFISIFGLFVYAANSGLTNSQPTKSEIIQTMFLIFLGLIFSFMLVMMILELLFITNGIEIDFKKKNILLKYFLIKSETIELSDIIQYSETTISTKSSSYECYLIHTKNKRKLLLGDFNLQECSTVKSFLDDNTIKFISHEKISMVSYFINNFRFKN